MKVGDLILDIDKHFGITRVWEVQSVCLGALGQEGLVQLMSLTEKAGIDIDGVHHTTTWVPISLLKNNSIYEAQKTAK